MRISDWSSDVCSSDLTIVPESTLSGLTFAEAPPIRRADIEGPLRWHEQPSLSQARVFCCPLQTGSHPERNRRSEEHTSELQSLMRISYAVFCLKKKKQPIHSKYTKATTHTTPQP